jgi:hypothetical protein
VYEKKPRTTVDFKQNIKEIVAAVSLNMLQRVTKNFQKSLGNVLTRTPPHRHYMQEVNVVIKMLRVKDNFSKKSA